MTPRAISLFITSAAFTPIFLARSPTEIVSPTFIRLLIALGIVISVFFILSGVRVLFSSRVRAAHSPPSGSTTLPLRSTPFFATGFFFRGDRLGDDHFDGFFPFFLILFPFRRS